jgi:transposase-like protein
MKFKSLPELLDYFKDDNVCREYYEKIRWNGKPVCPHCNHEKVYKTNRGYKCSSSECYKKFTVTVGTVFENTKIPLRLWFAAIYLCTAHKKGISSLQLGRDLNIPQKTAWFLEHRVREMLRTKNPTLLKGTVEVDGTLVGGQFRFKSKKAMEAIKKKYNTKTPRGNVGKTPIMGMLERGGKLITTVSSELDGLTLKPILKANIDKDAKVYTDYFGAYKGLGDYFKEHSRTNHRAGEYVRGDVHTNGLEGYWSLLKRGIVGIYHYVSPKHLHRYCDEFSARYNTRDLSEQDRFKTFLAQSQGRLKYDDLVKKVN